MGSRLARTTQQDAVSPKTKKLIHQNSKIVEAEGNPLANNYYFVLASLASAVVLRRVLTL